MIQIIHADVMDGLRQIPDQTVQCVVTSPPYIPGSYELTGEVWGLRDYGVEGQIGLEKTPEEYVAKMVEVFREVRRVLRDDGTVWLNLGDSYVANASNQVPQTKQHIGSGFAGPNREGMTGLEPKNMVGIPWLVAKALQAPYYTGDIKQERDRAWLAAMIDGEGSICATHYIRNDDGTPRTFVNIHITNTSLKLLDECDRIWKANRHEHHTAGEGHLGKRPCYRWIVNGVDNQISLIREIYPYLIIKKKQAILAYNLLLKIRVAKHMGHTSQRDVERAEREKLAKMIQSLNSGEDIDVSPYKVPEPLYEPGWYLRSDIIWSKPNPMPESVTDRPTKSHEYIFLLTKKPRYYYDADAVREKGTIPAGTHAAFTSEMASGNGIKYDRPDGWVYTGNRNRRTVWEIATQPFPGSHFATFPEALVEPCIKAGTSERGCCSVCGAPWKRVVEPSEEYKQLLGKSWHNHDNDLTQGARQDSGGPKQCKGSEYRTTGWHPSCLCYNTEIKCPDTIPCIVLDPFGGSGTVGKVARDLNRKAILIELNAEYIKIARERLRLNEQLGAFA